MIEKSEIRRTQSEPQRAQSSIGKRLKKIKGNILTQESLKEVKGLNKICPERSRKGMRGKQ
jgi:hypothetical protein